MIGSNLGYLLKSFLLYLTGFNFFRFDPLALLLDASLEGELKLVKKMAREVHNTSAANNEGITALHNAICAVHIHILQFLVESHYVNVTCAICIM